MKRPDYFGPFFMDPQQDERRTNSLINAKNAVNDDVHARTYSY
jgi:hypothetical protein